MRDETEEIGGEELMNTRVRRKASLIAHTVAVLMMLLAMEIIALVLWVRTSWYQWLTAVTAVISAYGIAVGLFSKSKELAPFREILDGLTAPNIFEYASANFKFLDYAASLLVVALSPRRLHGAPVWLGFLGLVLSLLLAPLIFVYMLFHLLVVTPLVYIPTVPVSSLVAAVEYSAEDVAVRVVDAASGQEIRRVSMRDIVQGDRLAAKGFLMGIPGFAVVFWGRVIAGLLGL